MITTSGPSGRTQRLEAYRAGAWEFLGQPLDGEALLLKLNTFLQCKREVDALREENLLDPGTGLYNMRGLSRRAREIGAEAFRRRDPVACVVFSPGSPREEEEPEEEEARRMSDQVALLFRQAGPGVRRDRAAGTVGVRRDRARHRPRGRGAPGPPARRRRSSPRPFRCAVASGRCGSGPGYCAVPDFAESSVDAVELLLRATTALRDLKREGPAGERIRAFEQVPIEVRQLAALSVVDCTTIPAALPPAPLWRSPLQPA